MIQARVSGEDNIDQALTMTGEGGMGVYKLIRFVQKHRKPEERKLLEEALSFYRGGAFDAAKEPALEELIKAFGGDSAQRRTFEFAGNRSDLSYFWAKDEKGQHLALPKDAIESIHDAETRQKVTRTLTRCYIDGVLDYNAKTGSYTLTEKGKAVIYDGEFVEACLSRDAAAMAQELEKAAMVQSAEKFADCSRVTVDLKSLEAKTTEQGLFCRVPNTQGKLFVEFEKGTYFKVSDKTVEAFIDPKKTYTLLSRDGKAAERCLGEKLASKYELKREPLSKKLDVPAKPADEYSLDKYISRQAAAVKGQAEATSKASFKAGDTVYATSQYEAGADLAEYKVSYAIEDKASGDVFYRLVPTDTSKPTILQTEQCLSKTLFPDLASGKAKLATEGGKALAAQTKNELAAVALGKDVAVQNAARAAKAGAQAVAATNPVTATASAAIDAVKKTVKAVHKL